MRKYNQKGLLVTLLFEVIKNLFHYKNCIFSKELIWHRSLWAEMGGNWPKMGF